MVPSLPPFSGLPQSPCQDPEGEADRDGEAVLGTVAKLGPRPLQPRGCIHPTGELFSLLLGFGGVGGCPQTCTPRPLSVGAGPQGEGVPGPRAQATDGDGWFFITASQVLPAPCVEILFIP